MRYKRTSGIGPFKRDRWEDEEFELQMEPGETATPAPELRLVCLSHAMGVAIQGTLKGQSCYFADLNADTGKMRASFVMTSVSGVELRGRAEIIP